MSTSTFACMINCMDGRVQEAVIHHLKAKLGVDFVDAVTEPGPIAHLSKGASVWVDNIKACTDVSVEKHNAKAVAIVGHFDCAGNPVSKEEQVKQLHQSVPVLKAWYPHLPIYALWVNEQLEVEEIVS